MRVSTLESFLKNNHHKNYTCKGCTGTIFSEDGNLSFIEVCKKIILFIKQIDPNNTGDDELVLLGTDLVVFTHPIIEYHPANPAIKANEETVIAVQLYIFTPSE